MYVGAIGNLTQSCCYCSHPVGPVVLLVFSCSSPVVLGAKPCRLPVVILLLKLLAVFLWPVAILSSYCHPVFQQQLH